MGVDIIVSLSVLFDLLSTYPIKQTDIQTILGWSGGAKVLGKLPVPRRPTNFSGRRPDIDCNTVSKGR